MLAINGGDGTVQAVLTELFNGGHFGDIAPPVAVLPSGKTNLIALDLGAQGDPVEALERLIEIAKADLVAAPRRAGTDRTFRRRNRDSAGHRHVPWRSRPRRHHALLPGTHLSARPAQQRQPFHHRASPSCFGRYSACARASCRPNPGRSASSFAAKGRSPVASPSCSSPRSKSCCCPASSASGGRGPLKFVAVEQKPVSMLRAFAASLVGRLGHTKLAGVHVEEADEIAIEGEASQVILDGETFRAGLGKPILLRPAPPLSFVRIAA